ncbi:MAG TPA: ABC transporter permease [Opitutales bacterium]|jgi:putative ABC transport system permease protein|nr:ABC transporter permease [Opitutales bacterium]
MFNWLNQVVSITLFNLRSMPERKGAAITTMFGIAGVVAVFVGVFSMAEGFRQAMTASGEDDVALVMRSGADNEMSSNLIRQDCSIISDAPGVARGANGPLVSNEMVMVIDLPKQSTGTDANVPLRGVDPTAFAVRSNVKLVEGRQLTPGRNELNVGVGALREFKGLAVGDKLTFGQTDWTVVGVFSADGGVSESEIWADTAVLQPAYHRDDNYQAVYAKLTSPDAFQKFKDALTSDPRLTVKAVLQKEYFADQSTIVTTFIKTIGFAVAAMMGLGALFGALNTMYSAVAARTREIATLRALGFGAGPVVLSVLFESIVLALIGGGAGAIAARIMFNGFTAATMNWQTFSQVAFAFAVTPTIMGEAMILAVAIGLFGGLFPGIRAARLPVAAALREI